MFANYILWLLMVYLTDVWELEIVHAAAIINIYMGLVKVLPILFAHLADAFLGNFFVVFFSSLSSMIGLCLLWISTPPVLGNKSNEHCTQYKPECIGEQQKQLFYAGLALISIGLAAHSACHSTFAHQEIDEIDDSFEIQCDCCCVGCRTHIVALAALLVAAFIKSWATLFGICAILGAISFFACLILLVVSIRRKTTPKPQCSSLSTIFRVLFAATSKSFCPRPNDVNELYEKSEDPQREVLPHTNSLRCLDKAAIIKPQPELEQQEKRRWNLCRVTEVEETKIFIRTIPIWMTYIVCGLISSLGATYFLEQAKRMDPRVGKAKAPLILFLWFYDQFKRSFTSNFAVCIFSGRYFPRIATIFAMVLATLTCIAAAKVETRRLGVVNSHNLANNPDQRVPMSIFWLLPQFALLGGFDGIHRLSTFGFSYDQAPVSMIKCFNLFAKGFTGLGVMGSVVLVYVVGKISESRTGTNWFQGTVNLSRLDNYYWVLAVLGAVNLVACAVVASIYRYRDSRYGQFLRGMLDPMEVDF